MATEKVVAELRDALAAAARATVPAAQVPAGVAEQLADVEGKREVRKLTVGGAAYYEVVITVEGTDDGGRRETVSSGGLYDANGKELGFLDAVESVVVFGRSPAEQEDDRKLSAFVANLLGPEPQHNAALRKHSVPLPPDLDDGQEGVQAFGFEFAGRRYVAKLVLDEDEAAAVTVFDAQHRPIGGGLPEEGPLVLQEVGDARPWSYGALAPRDEFHAGGAAKPAAAPPSGRAALKALASTKR